MIKIYIADDHDIVRQGLKNVISEQRDMTVCGETDDARDLPRKIGACHPDIVVLDVNMPGGATPALVHSLRLLPSSPQVVVFTMYPEDSHAVGFLREGAAAFINKRRSSADLLRAIRKAASGSQYVTPELADFLFENQIDVKKHPLDLLSAREVEVVRQLAAGRRATEIASHLGLATSTVNTFVERVKTKLGLRTVVEITQYARENGLLG